MISFIRGGALAALAVILASGAPQPTAAAVPPVALVVVNVKAVALGYRISQLIGRPVSNGKEDIGKIDDFVIGRDKVLFVIIGVGGFLGIGQHLVVAPYNGLTVTPQRILLPGATKEALRKLPEFRYVP
jgi:hypothetical protein